MFVTILGYLVLTFLLFTLLFWVCVWGIRDKGRDRWRLNIIEGANLLDYCNHVTIVLENYVKLFGVDVVLKRETYLDRDVVVGPKGLMIDSSSEMVRETVVRAQIEICRRNNERKLEAAYL